MTKDFDVYLAHAWEDKQRILPLVDGLRSQGLRVWYDDDQLESGRSLRQQLDEGLKRSEFGIVVLSSAFFTPGKRWAPMELDVWLEAAPDPESRILVVWMGLTKRDVQERSPLVATLLAYQYDREDLASRLADDVQSRLIRLGRFGSYLRQNLERNLEWVRPPQVIVPALRQIDRDTSWESVARLKPFPESLTPTLPEVFESSERFIARPLVLTGNQVFQQALLGAPRWQEFSLQMITRMPGYQRCLVLVHLAKVANYRLPIPRPPKGHLPLVEGLVVALGGVDFGDIWQTVVVHARNLSYISMAENDHEPSILHWPTDFVEEPDVEPGC